jgi:hypothetical protein
VEFGDDFYFPYDVLIEISKIFRGNPILKMQPASHFLYAELRKVASFHCEACHISNGGRSILGVPIARDLRGVLLDAAKESRRNFE